MYHNHMLFKIPNLWVTLTLVCYVILSSLSHFSLTPPKRVRIEPKTPRTQSLDHPCQATPVMLPLQWLQKGPVYIRPVLMTYSNIYQFSNFLLYGVVLLRLSKDDTQICLWRLSLIQVDYQKASYMNLFNQLSQVEYIKLTLWYTNHIPHVTVKDGKNVEVVFLLLWKLC